MEILKCGTLVIIKQAKIEGVVTCAAIRFEKITYEITYYLSGEQKTIWTHESEIEVKEKEEYLIGYKFI